MFSEAKLSAIAVSLVTGIGITLFLNTALRDLGSALAISVPVTLVMGGVMTLFASDDIKKGGEKPSKNEANKGE